MILEKKLIFSVVLLFFYTLSVQSVYSQTNRFLLFSARSSALGGSHAALTDHYSTIFNNAAGFRGVESDLTVSELTFKMTGPISTIILGAQGGDVEQILSDLGSSNIGFNMTGPISIGKIENNMAFCIFNVIRTNIFIPNLTQDAVASGQFDLGGAFGYSFGTDFVKSNSQLNFGFIGKLFFRSEVNITKSFTDLIAAFDDISSIFSPDSIPLAIGFGVGVDIGMKYIWNDVFSIGLALRDIYTPLFMFRYDSVSALPDGQSSDYYYSVLPADYSLGIMYHPSFTIFKGVVGDIKLMFDYNDIFGSLLDPDNKRHILLHFGIGAEFSVFEILMLRIGLCEGLPSAGLGLDLHIFKFNIAMFGSELGSQPGIMSVYNLIIGLEFSY